MKVLQIIFLLATLSHQYAPFTFTGNQAIVGETFAMEEALFNNASSAISEALGLGNDATFKRQIQTSCEYPGYLPCSNLAGKCCPAGDDCFSDRCCRSGYLPCGTSECFDPGDNFCCPAGKQRCGSSNDCYDPLVEKCCEGNGKVWGCKKAATCCADGGATACVDPETMQCCPGFGCLRDETCCGKECCTPIGKCGVDGYCVARYTTTTQPGTSTTTKTTITPKYSTSRISITTSSSASPTTSSACHVSRRSSDTGSEHGDIDKRQSTTFPADCPTACDPDGNIVPLLHIPYILGKTDQLAQSMCQGILQRQYLPSPKCPFPNEIDFTSGTDYITYAGGGRGTRDIECECSGRSRFRYCYNMNNDPTQCPQRSRCYACDEYPPATFTEGGELCTATCIELGQNSRQGSFISQLVQKCHLIGQQQVIKVQVDSCPSTVKVKRGGLLRSVTPHDPAEVVEFADSGSSNELLDLGDDDDSTYVEVAIGHIGTGNYHFDVTFDGMVDFAAILSADGYEYDSLHDVTGLEVLSFSTNDNTTDFIYLNAFTESQANVSYVASVNASTSSPSASVSSSQMSSAGRVYSHYVVGIVCLLLSLFLK